jgi:hypothetical protein
MQRLFVVIVGNQHLVTLGFGSCTRHTVVPYLKEPGSVPEHGFTDGILAEDRPTRFASHSC